MFIVRPFGKCQRVIASSVKVNARSVGYELKRSHFPYPVFSASTVFSYPKILRKRPKFSLSFLSYWVSEYKISLVQSLNLSDEYNLLRFIRSIIIALSY